MLAVNLTGTFLTFREGLRQMGPGGRLIAIASTAGLKGAAEGRPAYAAAKHGVIGLVRSVALEVARTQASPLQRHLPGLCRHRYDSRRMSIDHRAKDRLQPPARTALAALEGDKPAEPPDRPGRGDGRRALPRLARRVDGRERPRLIAISGGEI